MEGGMEQTAFEFEAGPEVYTVAELNAAIRDALNSEFSNLFVAGEISGVRLASSGHYYFTLKEQEAQLRCVCYRMTARYLKFKPQDGVAVVARGRIDVYEARGEYQLIVDALEPQGRGALQFAFEQLKKKLASEGLFDAARKRAIPKLPRRIGIVTSPVGAAVQDMLNILRRRFPGLHIRLFPAQVQGEGSIEDVCRGIEYFSRSGWAEVLIVGRGGGSLEDLWTFNEEAVARAIAACSVPVISAVGHETDFTIADFVADLRAATPSAAAELVVCTREQVLERIDAAELRLAQMARYRLLQARRRLHERGVDAVASLLGRRIGRGLQRLDDLDYSARHALRVLIEAKHSRLGSLVLLDPRLRFAQARRRLEMADAAAVQLAHRRLAALRSRFDPLAAQLSQLSPLRVLERGYAIVLDSSGAVVKDVLPAGSEVELRVARGRMGATITTTQIVAG
jgi:exodeoxyribonuclease VII large subunit